MSWYSPVKQAAVDPDNPTADEQFPFSEHNAMVAYLKDKIINKTVNATAIGDDKILVYDLASDTFVFETPSTVGTLNDLTDVVISGVPADNEVLAYNTGTSKFINQTAAEAGLATVTGLASYLELAGGTMAGTLNMGDYQINGLDDMQAHDASGILFRDNGGTVSLRVSSTANSFIAYDECSMNSNKITDVTDPTAAQDASTKNYDDTHLFTKEVVTDFTDGYIPVYRTGSGKFEMEAQVAASGTVLEADFDATTFLYATANNTPLPKTPAEVMAILSGAAGAEFLLNTQNIGGVVDPTTAQQASTKNYADTRVATKELVTSFTDNYIFVYKTSSGKFEMEAQSAAAGLPVSDSTTIVKGSADSTKRMRFEVDGLTAGVTRIMTVPDKDMTLCGTDDAMLLDGSNAMAGDLDMSGNDINNCFRIYALGNSSQLDMNGGTDDAAAIGIFGNTHGTVGYRGDIRFYTPNAAGNTLMLAMTINGLTDTPSLDLYYGGLGMNNTVIADMKNSAASALSGTQKDIEIDIGGTPYYFTVYPTKA